MIPFTSINKLIGGIVERFHLCTRGSLEPVLSEQRPLTTKLPTFMYFNSTKNIF